MPSAPQPRQEPQVRPAPRVRPARSRPLPVRAIVLLAAALALPAADQTIVGAVAPDLKIALAIGNTQIGMLVTVASLLAAASTIPFGVLADRVNRLRLLAGCALALSAAVTLAGLADSYGTVLIAQLLLGSAAGAAGPVVFSLAGDLFPGLVRGKALGYVLAGEFAGAASGLLLAGEVAALWSWRGSFYVMAACGPVLAIALVTLLREPVRGAQVRPAAHGSGPASAPHRGGLAAAVAATGLPPRRRHVLTEDPGGRPLTWVIRYVLTIPTNVVIIISSALCYFYVAGLQTFAIVFLRGRFDLSQEIATALLVVVGLGVIAGMLSTGGLSDRMISRGRAAARPIVGGICLLVALALFTPGFLVAGIWLALPLLFLGAAALGGANPPLDAARLDVVHHRLWGRAEAVRTVVQNLIKAGAPLLFGYLSVLLATPGEAVDAAQGGGAVGLTRAFLILQVTFAIAGIVLLAARRGYVRDVATTIASEAATRR